MLNKKILYISNSGEIGGGNRSLIHLLNNIRNQTNIDTVTFVPSQGMMADELRKLCFSFRIIDLESSNENRVKSLIRTLLYTYAIWKESPSVIHANDLMCHRLAGFSGKILNIPVVCHMRFAVDSERVDYFLRPSPKFVIFNSEYTRQSFFEYNPLYMNKIKSDVVYNELDSKQYYKPYYRESIRTSWGVNNQKVIGILGNFSHQKGHEFFLKLAKKLILSRHDLHFLVVGEDITEGGARRDSLERLTNSLELSQHVTFAGFSNDPGSILSGLDVLVVPSTFEPFGRVAAEGILAGVPVVASRTGGLIEIIQGMPGNYLVSPGDLAGFTEAVFSALLVSDNVKEIARNLAIERFGENRSFLKLLSIYNNIIENHKSVNLQVQK